MSVNIKKNILGIALIILFIGCAGGAKSTTGSGVIPLDQAIKAAAIEIEKIIPRGTKIALLNFNSPTVRFSEYVLDELSANLVSNRILTIVDRKETDLILGEFNFQLSGHVSDDSMQELGRMLGAQAIVSGSLTEIGRSYRIMIRVLNVQTAIVEVQYRTDIINDNRVQSLLAGSRTSGTVNASGNTTTNSGLATQQTTSSSTGGRSSTPVVVQGSSITEKLQWLEENAINNTKYRIEVTNNESLAAPTLSFPRRRNVTVWLISSGAERILSLTGNGSLFTIESDVTLILDNGITLRGRNQNDASLVRVNSRGTLIMNDGSKITSNNFRGVSVLENANFIMNGGEISNNTGESGSGVAVWGNFTMLGGLIVGNTVHSSYISHLGGGVFIAKGGRFTLKGGEISNNKITGRVGLMAGGGVYRWNFYYGRR